MVLHIIFALIVMASLFIIGWTLVYFIVRVIVGLVAGAVQWTERTRRDA